MNIQQKLISKKEVEKIDEKYMRRSIQLANNGLGSTFPNPMVGSVVVCNKKIIGEGYTSSYGNAHAEVNAINSVSDKSLLGQATLYVTLEPCSHYGKTPPCADLIIKHDIPRVVIGTLDPNQLVSGAGVQKLQSAGCTIKVGVLEEECRKHHKRFLTFHQKKRPYIILKWAETQDGFLAPDDSLRSSSAKPFWITNAHSRQLVHKWRSEEMGILVGTKTVLKDNPKLGTRLWQGHSPIRIILDKNLRIDTTHHVLDGNTETLVLTAEKNKKKYPEGMGYRLLDFSENLVPDVCQILFEENITSVIVEGGAQTLQAFINSNLWDEARVFKGPASFKKGLKAPVFSGEPVRLQQIDSDILNYYSND